MSRIVTFAAEELGIALTPGQVRAVAEFEDGGYEQAVWRWGRRSGKTLTADILALSDAVLRDHLRARLRPGEPRVSAIICPRLDQAQAHIASISGMVARSPRLSRLLVGETTDELTFANGSVIRAYPCSARSIRGGAWSSCILDELGHFVSTDDGNAAGDRVLEAALPSLAQFGSDAWLIAISTPLWRSGAFWKLCERAESGRFPYIHSMHATTADMNPMVPAEWLEARRREDPDLYAREFEARWIDGASSYLPAAEVVASVRRGVARLRPRPDLRYVAGLDPAYSHDAFALCVAHQDADDGRVIVDGVWAWRRHGHDATLDAVAEVIRAYRVRAVRTDQHAAQPILEGLARRRVHPVYEPWTNQTKADAFAVVKVALNTASIELPDDAALVEELCSLEARPTPSGLTRIAAAGSGHDDRAVALAAAVVQLRRRGPSSEELDRMREDNEYLRALVGAPQRAFGALSPGRLPIPAPDRYRR